MTATTIDTNPGRSRRLLGLRNFRLLWIGETTSCLGSSVTSVALPLAAVETLHAGPFLVSVLTAAAWLPWLVIGLPVGVWVDRLPRRPLMLASDIVALLAFLSVPVAAWTGHLTVLQLLVVALIAGGAAVIFQTSYSVFVPALLSDDLLTRGNAMLQGSQSAVQIAGPGLAGLIAQLFGAVTGLLADAVSFGVSAVCLAAIRPPAESRSSGGRARSLRADIGDGLRHVVSDPYLRVMAVFGAASNLVLTGYQAIMIVFLARTVGLGGGTIGTLLALSSVGGVIGATIAPRVARRFGSARSLLACELVAAPFAMLVPLTGHGARLAFPVLGGLLVGAGLVAGNVIKSGWRQAYVPRAILGRIIVSMQLVNYGTIPLGALLGGSLAAALGLRTALWITTAGVTLAALTLLTGPIRKHRDLPSAPAQARALVPAGRG